MAAPQEAELDKTVTYVQVVTVTDVAEAAALMASEMTSEMSQSVNNQIMQIVTMQAPSSTAGAGPTTIIANNTSTPPAIAPAGENNPATSPTINPNNTGDNMNNANMADGRLCMICGDRANGVHYNVLSCEGCKSFFLRSNRSGATFTCASGGNCNMDLYTRRHCPACRMKRCLECGMKVERVWAKDRLLTRKPLIRRRRKKKQPGVAAKPELSPADVVSSLTLSLTPSLEAPSNPATNTPPQQQTPLPTGIGVGGTPINTTPSSSRSSSPMLTAGVTTTVTPPSAVAGAPDQFPVAISTVLSPTSYPSTDTPMLVPSSQGGASSLMNPPATPGTSSVQTPLTLGPIHPQLTCDQEQLMLTLEKGYNASTEVLKHLSKDVPLFRMTYWSKLKGSEGNSPSSSTQDEDEEDEDEDDDEKMDQTEPKIAKLEQQTPNTNGNSEQISGVTVSGGTVAPVQSSCDPLEVLSASTGQNIDMIYKLTSLATNGLIKDPASALTVLASSAQGMRVIQTIGSLVQGQDLNTLISLAKLVGQIIGMGGGSLNDTLADTILGSITGSILNGSSGSSNGGLAAQLIQNTPAAAVAAESANQDQNGNGAMQTPSQDDGINTAAFAKLATSGLVEALAMLAAMASSSQNKETIIEMVKRAAVSLLKGQDEPQMMSFSSQSMSSAPSSSNFYMPTDVGEDEVKTSPFLQSLQRVTSYLTSGKMSADKKSVSKAKRTVNKEMLHIAMDMFAVLVKQTIHFAKSIPGFTNLSCDDQAVLIKSSIVDALLLRCADNYALDKDCLVNDTNGDKFDVHMMYQLGFSTLPEVVFEFMRDTKACGLTTAEYALFTAAALLSPDRSDLKDRRTVEEMQLEMILALQAATKVFHADKPFLFTKLITKLTTLRDMSILHLSEIMAVKVQEQDLSPLIVELFGLDS